MRTIPKTALKWTLLPAGKSKAQKRKNKNGEERGNVKEKSEAPNGKRPESVRELRDAHMMSVYVAMLLDKCFEVLVPTHNS